MLLEEVILHFLGANGYVAIDEANRDPTLSEGPSGLRVRGRGTVHQIDGIASYRNTTALLLHFPIRIGSL